MSKGRTKARALLPEQWASLEGLLADDGINIPVEYYEGAEGRIWRDCSRELWKHIDAFLYLGLL